MRIIVSCITQRKAQGPSRTFNGSKEDPVTNVNKKEEKKKKKVPDSSGTKPARAGHKS